MDGSVFCGRAGGLGNWSPGRAPQYLLELFGGQIALATPLIFLLCVAGVALAARSAWRKRDPAWSLLAILSLLPVLVFAPACDRRSGPAELARRNLSRRCDRRGRIERAVLAPAANSGDRARPVDDRRRLCSGGIHAAVAATQARSDRAANVWLAGTRRRCGRCAAARSAPALSRPTITASPRNWPANYPPRVPVIAIGPRWSSFNLPAPAVDGMTGLLVQPEHHATPIWPAAEEIGTVTRETPRRRS